MQNPDSRKESIERRKILRLSKVIDRFIDGDQGDHDLRNRSSPAADVSSAEGYSSHPDASNRTEDDSLPHAQHWGFSTTAITTGRTSNAQTTRDGNTVVSKPDAAADDGNIDSMDKRDRDLVVISKLGEVHP